MRKVIILSIIAIIFFQTAQAQKSDGHTYFFDYSDKLVSKSKAYYLLIITPPDSISGIKLYHCNEYYVRNKIMKFDGASKTNKADSLVFEGRCVYYDFLGNKTSVINYLNGEPFGRAENYYPNGQLNTILKYEDNGQVKLIEYRDSTGNVLASNGNGKWIKASGKFEIEKGMIKDSLKEGGWQEYEWGGPKYINTYNKGVVVATTDPNFVIGEPVYDEVTKSPGFNGKYSDFLMRNLRYPARDRENNIQGKVITSFIVEKNGSISDIRTISSPDESLADESVRVIKLFPDWIPGTIKGKAVRTRFILPLSYALNNGD